jgi:DNA-binding MarR family transcriptional regulator
MEEPDATIERALVRMRRDQQAGHLQRRATAPAETDAAPAAADAAANAARFRYLDALDDATDGLPISQIADAIGVDRPRASRLTTALVADGLAERRGDPADSRVTRIRLTPAGRAVVDGVHATRRHAVTEALRKARFTGAEAETFAELLDRFVEAWPRA